MHPSIHQSVSQCAHSVSHTREKDNKNPKNAGQTAAAHYTLLLCAAPVMLQLLLTEPAGWLPPCANAKCKELSRKKFLSLLVGPQEKLSSGRIYLFII
jgi:hypothetical protein